MLSINVIAQYLGAAVAIVNHAYIYIISTMWLAIAQYGISPSNAYLQPELSQSSFVSLFAFFSGIDAQIIALIAAISAILFLSLNSLYESPSPVRYVVRLAAGVSVMIFSFDIMKYLLVFEHSLYSLVWQSAGLNWYSLTSILGLNSKTLLPTSLNGINNELVTFLLLTSLFTVTGTMLGTLMIREALLLVLIITLPFISALFIVPGLDRYAYNLWVFTIQMTALPFIMLVPIYLASLFSFNFPLQLALLGSVPIIPVIFLREKRAFSLGAVLSLFDLSSSQPFSFVRSYSKPNFPPGFSEKEFLQGKSDRGVEAITRDGKVRWEHLESIGSDYRRYGGDRP